MCDSKSFCSQNGRQKLEVLKKSFADVKLKTSDCIKILLKMNAEDNISRDLQFRLINLSNLIQSIQELTTQLLLEEDCLAGVLKMLDSKGDIFYDLRCANLKVNKTMQYLKNCFSCIVLEYCRLDARKEDFEKLFSKFEVKDFTLNENKQRIYNLTKILFEKIKFDQKRKQKERRCPINLIFKTSKKNSLLEGDENCN